MTADQSKSVGDQFLDEYLSRGLGNMPKREIDVKIFHLLRQEGAFDGMSVSEISNELRITPTRVKSLMYDASLRFEPQLDEAELKKRLVKYFTSTPIVDVDSKWVMIQFEDPILRDGFIALAKKQLQLTDRSFGSEIVKISKNKYSDVLISMIDKKKVKELNKEVKKLAKKDQPTTIRKLIDAGLNQGVAATRIAVVTQLTPLIADANFVEILAYAQEILNSLPV